MDINGVIGLISGMLAIFTFLTGATSLRQLLTVGARRRQVVLLAISVPVFAVSMIVTLSAGLNGSDTGGARFLLLLISAVLLVWFAARGHRFVPWPGFVLMSVVVLAGLGLLFGSISRGEEAEGLQAGLLLGVVTGVAGGFFRGAATGADRRRPADAARSADAAAERAVLAVARDSGGETTVSEVALRTPLSLDEARQVLDGLVARQFAERLSSANGAVVYRFPDLGPR